MCKTFDFKDYKHSFQKVCDNPCGCYSITKYYTNDENNNNTLFMPSESIYDYKCLEHNYELKRLQKRLDK